MHDFEITVHAAEDDEVNGILGARGAAGGPPEDHDFAHVRNFVKGQLTQIEGMLPLGWSFEIVEHTEVGDQRAFVGNVRQVRTDVELPPDRLDQIKTATCAGILVDGSVCGRPIVDQGDGVWYHEEPCAEPSPVESTIT